MFSYLLQTTPLPLRRQSLGSMMSASTATLLCATGILIIFLALIILFNQNYNATKGYKLRTLERERSQLLLTEEVLKMHIAQAQALSTFQNDPVINTMVQATNPMYVRDDTAVARQE